jgi:hypothetical protein
MEPEPQWRLEFPPGAVDSHYTSDGSIVAALAWLEKVLDGRLADAWVSTGALFRLALTRYWCWKERFELHEAGHDPLEIAAVLADDSGPAHPLWPAFTSRQRLPESAGVAARSVWVAAGPPEPVGPDLEVVELLLADTLGTGHRCPPLTLLLRLGPADWQVAGHGRAPARVGWPPCQ